MSVLREDQDIVASWLDRGLMHTPSCTYGLHSSHIHSCVQSHAPIQDFRVTSHSLANVARLPVSEANFISLHPWAEGSLDLFTQHGSLEPALRGGEGLKQGSGWGLKALCRAKAKPGGSAQGCAVELLRKVRGEMALFWPCCYQM